MTDATEQKIWGYKLLSSYRRIIYDRKIDGLSLPILTINPELNCQWGRWSSQKRCITLSSRLLRDFEWGAVEFVLKHEMAHQIVDELWELDRTGRSHGAAFKKACKMVGVRSDRSSSAKFLSQFKRNNDHEIADKIRKLLAKGSDQSISKEESKIFLSKAQAIMAKYNISMADVSGYDRLFLQRPLMFMFKRWPKWMWILGNMLEDHYQVRVIRTYCHTDSYLELFGDPKNLDVAEYVAEVLIKQGERLYQDYLKNGDNLSGRKKSKTAFMSGLMEEFRNRLALQKDELIQQYKEDDNEYEHKWMILKEDPALREHYDEAYPNRKNVSYSGHVRGAGYYEGRKAGKNIQIRQGINSSNGSVKQLA